MLIRAATPSWLWPSGMLEVYSICLAGCDSGSADSLAMSFTKMLSNAAHLTVGKKKVGVNSKPWFDKESVFLSSCLSVLPVCLFVCLFVCLSVCLPIGVCLFLCLSFYLSVCLFVCLSFCLLSVYVCLSICLSVCLFV